MGEKIGASCKAASGGMEGEIFFKVLLFFLFAMNIKLLIKNCSAFHFIKFFVVAFPDSFHPPVPPQKV